VLSRRIEKRGGGVILNLDGLHQKDEVWKKEEKLLCPPAHEEKEVGPGEKRVCGKKTRTSKVNSYTKDYVTRGRYKGGVSTAVWKIGSIRTGRGRKNR